MSSAFYPLGMNSYNNRIPQGGYKTWKGNGVYQNPIGVVSTNIRPLTNNDYGNVFPSKNGLPRPIKHYRKGRVIPCQPIPLESTSETNEENSSKINNEIELKLLFLLNNNKIIYVETKKTNMLNK